MITAAEAKALYDESGQEVDNFLKSAVEPLIVSSAKSGKRSTMMYLDTIESFHYLGNHVTPLHCRVADKLKELGYTAEIRLYGDKYVPAGLRDDDGNGPLHQNYGIHIGW